MQRCGRLGQRLAWLVTGGFLVARLGHVLGRARAAVAAVASAHCCCGCLASGRVAHATARGTGGPAGWSACVSHLCSSAGPLRQCLPVAAAAAPERPRHCLCSRPCPRQRAAAAERCDRAGGRVQQPCAVQSGWQRGGCRQSGQHAFVAYYPPVGCAAVVAAGWRPPPLQKCIAAAAVAAGSCGRMLECACGGCSSACPLLLLRAALPVQASACRLRAAAARALLAGREQPSAAAGSGPARPSASLSPHRSPASPASRQPARPLSVHKQCAVSPHSSGH